MANNDSNCKLLIQSEDTLSDVSVGGGGHTITAYGGARLSAGKAKFGGRSIFFPAGANAYLEIPSSDDWAFGSGPFSIDFWFYSIDPDNTAALISRGDYDGDDYWCVWRSWYGGSMGFACRGGGDVIAFGNDGSSAGYAWNHYAMTRNGVGGDWDWFINGERVGGETNTPDAVPVISGPIRIGCLLYASVLGSFFHGYIDELRIVTGVCAYNVVGDMLYIPGGDTLDDFTPPSRAYSVEMPLRFGSNLLDNTYFANLIAAWRCEDAGGGLVDTIGGYDASIENAPTYQQTGINGYCVDFDGTNDALYVSDDNNLDFGAGDSFTIAAWVKADDCGSYSRLIEKIMEVGGIADGYFVRVKHDTNHSFSTCSNNSYLTVTNSGIDIEDGSWHLLVAVRDQSAGKIYLYVDDTAASEDESSRDISTGSDLWFGDNQVGSSVRDPYDGKLDEIYMWNAALSADAIHELYNGGVGRFLTPVWKFNNKTIDASAGSLAHGWPFDEAAGPAEDVVGSASLSPVETVTFGATGKHQGAVSLEGSGCLKGGDLGTAAVTMNMWIHFDAAVDKNSPAQRIFEFENGGSFTLGSASNFGTDETLMLHSELAAGVYDRTYIRDNVSIGWHMVTLRWDSGNSRYDIFLDGEEKTVYASTDDGAGHVEQFSLNNFFIGDYVPDLEFSGDVDQWCVWTTALSDAQITALYNGGAGTFLVDTSVPVNYASQYAVGAGTSVLPTGNGLIRLPSQLAVR
jgi:hypothetical protein